MTLLLAALALFPPEPPSASPNAPQTASPRPVEDRGRLEDSFPGPQAGFMLRLQSLCGGEAYRGRVVSDDPQDADWRGQPLTLGPARCTLTDDARMLAIARSTGRVRWVSQLARYRDEKDREGPIFWTGPVLAGNSLYVASSEGEIWRLSTAEGSAQMFQDIKAPVSVPPIVANRTLYVLDDSGQIHAYR